MGRPELDSDRGAGVPGAPSPAPPRPPSRRPAARGPPAPSNGTPSHAPPAARPGPPGRPGPTATPSRSLPGGVRPVKGPVIVRVKSLTGPRRAGLKITWLS
ncbi:hypothetical protein Plec18170_009809, partial [Paecilomyces lecythidis]